MGAQQYRRKRRTPGRGVAWLILAAIPAFAAPPLKVGFGNMRPMCYRDSTGRAQGFAVEAFNEAARRAGLELVWQPVDDSRPNNEALSRGDFDLLATGYPTPERRSMFYVSEPWWSAELLAVTPAAGPIRREADLDGRRLAIPASATMVVHERFPNGKLLPRGSAVSAAEAACTGEADAALFAGMFVRELLLAAAPACRTVSLRTLDTNTRIDYAIVARRAAAEAARALRESLDEITADGTLASIASRHPPVSTPYATRLAEVLRMRHERQLWRIGLAAAALGLLLGVAFLLGQHRSRVRLRAANAQLAEDLAAIKRAETALRDSEARFRALLDSAPQAVLAVDQAGVIAFANAKSEEMFGYAREDWVGMSADLLIPERIREVHAEERNSFFSHPRPRVLGDRKELFGLRQDGTEFPIEINLGYVEREGHGLALAFIGDISERIALEQQLRQAQKMEAVGQLAGGIAHDFNNLLTIISGYSELLQESVPPGDPISGPLSDISSAAARATALTGQLLAFSRRQPSHARNIELNDVVRRLEKMLRRLIGEHIELFLSLPPEVGSIHADPTQIDQVILNLAINAQDAMPNGGKLIIETGGADLEEEFAHLGLPPGSYATLTVTDSGAGIPPEVRERIFEPFFTTKPVGRGTGLGLSTVYGIVRQAGGAVSVYSEVGKGTAFKLYFPLVADETPPAVEQPAASLGSSGETILIAEDEEGVRSFVRHLLEARGYRVLEAADADEALRVAGATTETIHALLTDVVMPGISGVDLARELQASHPETRVLYMSGYTGTALAVRDGLNGHFVQKPFTPRMLLTRLRAMLSE